MKAKLSDRVRPNSEVADWVWDEIKLLEATQSLLVEALEQLTDACMIEGGGSVVPCSHFLINALEALAQVKGKV